MPSRDRGATDAPHAPREPDTAHAPRTADDPAAGGVAWSDLAEHAPDGLAVVDEHGRFLRLNAAAVALCARPAAELVGRPAPFDIALGFTAGSPGLLDDGAAEQMCTWTPGSGPAREFAYRTRPLPGEPPRTVVAFRDVSAERHRQRRVAAIARTAAKLASEGSLTAMLDALAQEVLRADMLAAVQILTLDESGESLQIMGSAGFPRRSDFFDLLMACRDRGATLRMLDAFELAEPVVIADRGDAIQADPAWEPLHAHMGALRWDWFASVPLLLRGRAIGIINAYFAPGQVVGRQTLEFLEAMADQAAVAVDYVALLRDERELARREERQRLARDLHDSIVQQVFSISMQAKVMGVLGARTDTVPADSVRRIADEVGALSKTVLTDLRAMVHELRPSLSTQLGLEEAVRALTESTTNRTGLRFDLVVGAGLEQIGAETAEDVYRVVAEAIHNVVKHAGARWVTLRMGVRDHSLVVTVADDGKGLPDPAGTGTPPGGGYGLTSMRERAERWGGTVRVAPGPGGGTEVRLSVPLAVSVPRDPTAVPDDPAPAAGRTRAHGRTHPTPTDPTEDAT
ncbi:ATP-binding protein [Streptomyces sp. NRRL F-5065]|uniref:sensor histidine kinase n=1 Tax=Streptomyces sp. NRRL F-5065 TaxID=1463855 RepID=UPI00099CF8E7|nr:ATP-binding protein [Streptomyces sp. NRRL F-5065]